MSGSEGGRALPPHPGPLPRGEGEAQPAPPPNQTVGFSPRLETILPLPEGEGRGEGEERVRLGYCSKTEFREAASRTCRIAPVYRVKYAVAKTDDVVY